MARKSSKPRAEGMIRRRGNSFQAIVFAGMDPVTGRQLYLRGSSATEADAKRMLRKFLAQVAEQRHAKTRASLRTTIEAWLETHELEESTREGYLTYATKHIYPVLGDEQLGKVTTHVLERFYAELRRCSARCDGRPVVQHRVDGPHECREVRHKRPPGRPPAVGYAPHDCEDKGCTVVECCPHVCRPLASATVRKIHFIVRGALTAAERWGWITSNPAEIARIPRSPTPDPRPPTTAEAAALVAAACGEDPERLDGVGHREAAEALRGTELRVPREVAPELEEDEHWTEDLLGLRVHDGDGERVGTVARVLDLPSCAVLGVQRPGAGELLVPLVRDAVPELDVGAGWCAVDRAFLGLDD